MMSIVRNVFSKTTKKNALTVFKDTSRFKESAAYAKYRDVMSATHFPNADIARMLLILKRLTGNVFANIIMRK